MANSRDDVVIQTDGRDAFAPEERHSLLESARLCEMIVEANPADTGALETLKEIYTKLGDRDKLMRVVAALAVLLRRARLRRRRGVEGRHEVDDVPPSRPRRPARSAGRRPSGAWRASATGWSPRGSSRAEQLAQALAAQKGTRDKLGTDPRPARAPDGGAARSASSRSSTACPSITLTQLDIDPDVLRLVPAPLAEKLRGAADQAHRATRSRWPWPIPPTCSRSTTSRS